MTIELFLVHSNSYIAFFGLDKTVLVHTMNVSFSFSILIFSVLSQNALV